WIPQTVTVQAQDDLLIEGNVPAPIVHQFASADPVFNGLSSEVSVSVIDNDFQRSLEPEKLPSAGNNYIRYDLSGDAKAQTSAGDYDLGSGNDILEVSAALQSTAAVTGTQFFGSSGNDVMSGVAQADGGTGDDRIDAGASGHSFSVNISVEADHPLGVAASVKTITQSLQQIAGGSGNDVI
ncbi:MAG: hypothetical protein CFE26_23490, partial [Verrucomicrobiales bacterium VVV1]